MDDKPKIADEFFKKVDEVLRAYELAKVELKPELVAAQFRTIILYLDNFNTRLERIEANISQDKNV